MARREVLFGLGASILLPSIALAGPKIRAFSVRGLTGVLSEGMVTLSSALNKVPGVVCTVESQGLAYCENVGVIADQAEAAAKKQEKIVLAGHSFGGDCVVRVAAELKERKIPVALLCAVDASWFSCPPVPANVATAISYYQTFEIIGREKLVPGTGFHGTLIEKHYDGGHLAIDKSPAVQKSIIAQVRHVVGLPAVDPKILPPDPVDDRQPRDGA